MSELGLPGDYEAFEVSERLKDLAYRTRVAGAFAGLCVGIALGLERAAPGGLYQAYDFVVPSDGWREAVRMSDEIIALTLGLPLEQVVANTMTQTPLTELDNVNSSVLVVEERHFSLTSRMQLIEMRDARDTGEGTIVYWVRHLEPTPPGAMM